MQDIFIDTTYHMFIFEHLPGDVQMFKYTTANNKAPVLKK